MRWLLIEIDKDTKLPNGRWQGWKGTPPHKSETKSKDTEWFIVPLLLNEKAEDAFHEYVGAPRTVAPYWKRGHNPFSP